MINSTMRAINIYAFLLLCSLKLAGQGLPADFISENYIESLAVITDRDFYVVHESINLKAFNLSPSMLRDPEWSKVLYLELVGFDGKPFVQSKIPFGRSGGEGQLRVPEGILSGVYYIKAYTKWMRNYGPNSYYYKAITLLNPYSDSVYHPDQSFEADFYTGYSSLKDLNGGGIRTDKDQYSFRNEGHLLFPDSTSGHKDLCVSITREKYVRDSIIEIRPKERSFSFSNKFLPETRGISISGVLTAKSSQKPISNRNVNVSLKKGSSQTFSTYTDSSGNFNIVLPGLYGDAELLILAEDSYGEELEIRLKSDFCKQSVILPFIPLKTGKQDRLRYNNLLIDSQIEALYYPEEREAEHPELQELYLYDDPSLHLDIDQFIKFSSLAELFKELVPAVGFRQENKRTTIFITGPYYYNLDTYKPLVLLDGIVVSDIDKLLQIDPDELSYIESYNYPYVLGDISYGGIIKLKSKEGDMAGYVLPSTGLIYRFRLLDPIYSEDTLSIENHRDPIISNTLFWECHTEEAKEKQNFHFNVGDNSGAYSVILHEIGENGKMNISKYDFNLE